MKRHFLHLIIEQYPSRCLLVRNPVCIHWPKSACCSLQTIQRLQLHWSLSIFWFGNDFTLRCHHSQCTRKRAFRKCWLVDSWPSDRMNSQTCDVMTPKVPSIGAVLQFGERGYSDYVLKMKSAHRLLRRCRLMLPLAPNFLLDLILAITWHISWSIGTIDKNRTQMNSTKLVTCML